MRILGEKIGKITMNQIEQEQASHWKDFGFE